MYLTYAEFTALCPESEVDEEQFAALERRAESDIDTLTFNRITAMGFERLTDFQRERIKRSAALQVKLFRAAGKPSERLQHKRRFDVLR
nr:MAG TPA: Head Tail Connector Protein [Caudoviricetes sp.]